MLYRRKLKLISWVKCYLDMIEEGMAVIIYRGGELSLPAGMLSDGNREACYLNPDLTIDSSLSTAARSDIGRLQQRLRDGGRAGVADDTN